MKKSIFILAALLTATFANSQITKVWTGHIDIFGSSLQVMEPTRQCIIGNYLGTYRDAGEGAEFVYYDIYDASSLSVVKTFQITDYDDWFNLNDENVYEYYFYSKGIFTSDNKWACLAFVGTKEDYLCENCGVWSGSTVTRWNITEIQVRNEDGAVLAIIPYSVVIDQVGGSYYTTPKLVKAGNSFKLFVPVDPDSYETRNYDVYSLPGDDSAQDLISIPSSNNISSRKYLHNDQVLIDSHERTYNMKGQVVR